MEKNVLQKKKQIVIKLEIDMITSVPSDWDEEMINFFYNDGSHCTGNEIEQLYREDNAVESSCFTCHRSIVQYLRDASQQDIVLLTRPKAGSIPGKFGLMTKDEVDELQIALCAGVDNFELKESDIDMLEIPETVTYTQKDADQLFRSKKKENE